MDNKSIVDRLYQRMKTYSTIQEMAVDSPKIGNLSYEEMLFSFLEAIHIT